MKTLVEVCQFSAEEVSLPSIFSGAFLETLQKRKEGLRRILLRYILWTKHVSEARHNTMGRFSKHSDLFLYTSSRPLWRGGELFREMKHSPGNPEGVGIINVLRLRWKLVGSGESG